MDWMTAIAIALLVSLFAIVFGRARHHPPRGIALNAVGYPAFLLGIGWASSVSQEAFYAAAAASLGALLFTMAAEEIRRSRTVNRPVSSGGGAI